MIRRPACVTVLVVAAAVAACKTTTGVSSGGAPASGEFSDNPLVAFIPADTAYAFATFKPPPLDVFRKLAAMMGPIWRRAFASSMSREAQTADQRRSLDDVLHVFDTLDVKTFEDHGFSAKARFAAYGIAGYPVFRVEVLSGDRVFELIRSTAVRWNDKLPPPTERAGRRYWIFDQRKFSVFVAIAAKELVVAAAPRRVLDTYLAQLVGEQPPANHLTTAQFRALAERDGFSAVGVGFVDLARAGSLVVDATGVGSECGAAVAALARRTPRLAVGYSELTVHRMGFGMIVEVAPDLLTQLRGLAGSLAGFDRVLAQRPAMAIAVAGNIEHGRALVAKAAGSLQELGERCQIPGLIDHMASVISSAGRPLPPVIAGMRGGFLVLSNLKMGASGPETIEGFGSLQLDDAGALLALLSSQLPGLEIKADRKAHALPALIPFPGHVAASERAIGVALGANSAAVAVDTLQGTAAPAPLAVFALDYSRLGQLVLSDMHGEEAEAMRTIMDAFGLATLQIAVDARGVVMSGMFELR